MREEIKQRIPQREPFLFVDKIVEQQDKMITTEYNVTGEEDFFKGHFPSRPVLPGVIIQEALFQSGALLMSFIEVSTSQEVGVVTRVQQAKFRKIVEPSQTLTMKVELVDQLGGGYFFKGKTLVDSKVVASVEFTCAKA